ncbi:MAG: hypothetical protein HN764_05830 [Gammaproteobacteria bacterium]|jgi:Rps23 Pro-64 3,4-dihydroxylase Tpa1-like proline 4-hydroxylase|nr:hypothetical protein [Gammaproteobacteria bacterium]
MPDKIEINPAVDPVELGKELQHFGRLQIKNFLTEDSAEMMHRWLLENKSWYLAYNDGDNFYESPMADIQQAPADQRKQMMNNIYQRATKQFQYLFIQYYITQAIKLGEDEGHPMHQVHDWINEQSNLDFMRTLTGESAIQKADSYASCYSPGHFLTQHEDHHETHDRVAAYVISMTKTWDVNWGGHLAFYDELGNIEQAFIPSFNCLNIFLIPQRHAVQSVAPFAGANRISYLGWLHR